MENCAFKEGDRVKRKVYSGAYGIVKDVREETVGSTGDTREKAIIVKVLWDNGTLSYFDPSALEAAK